MAVTLSLSSPDVAQMSSGTHPAPQTLWGGTRVTHAASSLSPRVLAFSTPGGTKTPQTRDKPLCKPGTELRRSRAEVPSLYPLALALGKARL